MLFNGFTYKWNGAIHKYYINIFNESFVRNSINIKITWIIRIEHIVLKLLRTWLINM